jgi:pimeloyl-ACP methyl ester carboxylesterase
VDSLLRVLIGDTLHGMAAYLLVHGGSCGSWVWERTVPALEDLGHQVATVDLPSSGPDAAELRDLHADSTAVRGALDTIDGDVVLVGHSGGGMVLAELADHPRVQHSVYVAALHPQKGQSAADLLGGQMPGWVVIRDDGAVQVSDDAEVVRQALCADVEAAYFAREVHPRYVLTSLSSMQSASTGPERKHAASYVVCEQDQALPVQAQEALASNFDRVERLPSSHSPMLSMPERLAEVLSRTSSAT